MDYKRVLKLRFTNEMSSREIAETTGDGKTTVRQAGRNPAASDYRLHRSYREAVRPAASCGGQPSPRAPEVVRPPWAIAWW